MKQDKSTPVCTVHLSTGEYIEIRRLEGGGLIGLDGSWLEQTDDTIYSPYDEGVEVIVPFDEDCPTGEDTTIVAADNAMSIEEGYIKAEVHSDNHYRETLFNAVAWFKQATDGEIEELLEYEFRGDYSSDRVALFIAESNSNVHDVLSYVEDSDGVGFECVIDATDAINWLIINKPNIKIPDSLVPETPDLKGLL